MIFTASIWDFFEFAIKEWHNIFISGFTRYFDPENISVDTNIGILRLLELELFKLDFRGGHFENQRWPP